MLFQSNDKQSIGKQQFGLMYISYTQQFGGYCTKQYYDYWCVGV